MTGNGTMIPLNHTGNDSSHWSFIVYWTGQDYTGLTYDLC